MYMIFLNQLLMPDIGLILWTTVAFFIFLFLFSKYAWKPIMKGVKKREHIISKSLKDAQKITDNLNISKRDYAKIMKEAAEEKKRILDEADALKKAIISEAKIEARKQADKILQEVRQEIKSNEEETLRTVKHKIADLVIELSEKILREQLKDKKKEVKYIDKFLESVHF